MSSATKLTETNENDSKNKASLPNLPHELLYMILSDLNSYIWVLNLSRTCRIFRDLFTNDPTCSTQLRTLFKEFEHSGSYILSKGMRKVLSKNNKGKRSIVRLSRSNHRKGSAHRPRNTLLMEGYLPCYFCCRFKPEQNFVQRQRAPLYLSRWSFQKHVQDRFCLDCVISGQAIDRFNELQILPNPLQPWENNTFLQKMPAHCNGWRLGKCRKCGQTSWTEELPSNEQLQLELCNACHYAKKHQICNFVTEIKLGIVDNFVKNGSDSTGEIPHYPERWYWMWPQIRLYGDNGDNVD